MTNTETKQRAIRFEDCSRCGAEREVVLCRRCDGEGCEPCEWVGFDLDLEPSCGWTEYTERYGICERCHDVDVAYENVL